MASDRIGAAALIDAFDGIAAIGGVCVDVAVVTQDVYLYSHVIAPKQATAGHMTHM